MERCLDCNSLLTKEEKVCMECGTKVNANDSSPAGLISSLVSIMFYISCLALVASPFVDRLPSFFFCLFITFALLFVMRTAKDSVVQKVRRH
jgi:hypothetical protein